jgi:hypothetical protein
MTRARLKAAIIVPSLAAVFLAAGCSGEPDLIPVSGAVKIDGKPAEGVRVEFWPTEASAKNFATRYAVGMSGTDGRFQLRSSSEKGLEGGEYRVTFSRMVLNGKVVTDLKKKLDHTTARQTLPKRYTDKDQPDAAAARVAKDNNDFIFDLSSRAK